MRLASLHHDSTTVAVRLDEPGAAIPIPGYADLSELLKEPGWREIAKSASGEAIEYAESDFLPVVPHPGKILCVGLNYAQHIREMGRDLPEHPTLFAKFEQTLTGAYDDIEVPEYASEALDWEGELAFVLGKIASRVSASDALSYIAGYTVMNDYTMRDYQYRTPQWDQGKNFERTSGFGPWLTTTESYELGTRLETRLDGEIVQSTSTDDMVFSPADLVEYISHILTLHPGDVVVTGTPGGVGHARKPPVYITDGQTIEVSIDGLGSIRNRTRIIE